MNQMVHIYGSAANVASCFTNIAVIHNMVLISLDARISVCRSTQNGINNIISCTGVYIFITTPETHAMLVINTRDKNSVVMMLMSGADSAQPLIEVLCPMCLYN